ncbi:MAG: glycosyltransferase family 39 protein, partial [Bdellovibrionales bacterium]|nr:glycosyltransferase family 39 protein [Bdellovibrionales bacterium]
ILVIVLLSLEPNLTAHSSLLTTDIPFSASLLLFMYSFLRLNERLQPVWAFATGLTLGLLFVSKYTASFILGAAILVAFASWISSFHRLRCLGQFLLSLVIVAVTSCFVICLFYLWVGVGTPLGEFHFFNPQFREIQQIMPWLPVPLPYDFISGFDHLSMAAKRDQWNNIILGEWHGQGIWSYYLILMFLKTPLALLVISIVGICRYLGSIGNSSKGKKEGAGVLLLAVLLFLHFSLFVKVQVGYRYVLMTLPLFLIVASSGLEEIFRYKKNVKIPAAVLLTLALVEIAQFPINRLSFSNILVSPKREAFRYLADSNLDWGQNRGKRAQFFREEGLEGVPINPHHILLGLNIFPVNHLIGVFWNFEQHRWARANLPPIRHLNHTELLFYVSPQQFLQFLKEERALEPLSSLPEGDLLSEIAENGDVELLKSDSRKLLRFFAEENGVIQLKGNRGVIELGPASSDGSCAKEKLE